MKASLRVLAVVLSLLYLFTHCEKEDPYVYITDDNFLNALIEQGVDTDGDGLISNAEAEVVISLDVSYCDISDMTGIKKFVNLKILHCGVNHLTSLDVSSCPQLSELECENNQLTSLDVSNNKELNKLGCASNQLSSVDVSKNTALSLLECNNNQLTNLDVSKNNDLERLSCDNTQLTDLDVSKNNDLMSLSCSDNQ